MHEIAAQIGLEHRQLTDGQRVVGIYRHSVMLTGERCVVLDDRRGGNPVPRRPMIEERQGRQIDATVCGGGV